MLAVERAWEAREARTAASQWWRHDLSNKGGEQVAALLILYRREATVVDQENVEAGELAEQAEVGAIGAGQGELVEEAGGAAMAGAIAFAARLMGQGTGMKLFPTPVAPTRITLWCSAIQRQVASWRMTLLSSSRRAG